MTHIPIPPGCDDACQAKIILNGGNVANNVGEVCYQVGELHERGMSLSNGEEVIKLLNKMEDDSCKLQALYLKGVGYTGEVGKMLK